MKIAIVAPSPVPFVVGGAENLCWGLLEHINRETPHSAELVKLPFREDNFWSVIEGYRRFSELDLDHFDCVISTKYPSWMVRHRNHRCWMLHPLRGLYDTYHFANQPIEVDWSAPGIGELKQLMTGVLDDREGLARLFRALHSLRERPGLEGYFAFPGPLSRAIVHYLDNIGLAASHVTKHAAISRTVAGRAGYFPEGVAASVVYPPPNLAGLRQGGYGAFFTASRLDRPKRIELIIRAIQQLPDTTRLRIAGTGPDEGRLRELAGSDPRIEFLGFLEDRPLAQEYASSRAVIFVPQDEDLGLITLEAMRCAKPVVTAVDSGGPTEFVTDGVNGFCVAPTAEAIANAFRRFVDDPAMAVRLGEAAKRTVAPVTWGAVISELLDEPATAQGGRSVDEAANPERSNRRATARPTLLVALSFPVFPPTGGGQARVYHLYRHLANRADVEIVSLVGHGELATSTEIAPGLREHRVPRSLAHAAEEARLSSRVDWTPIGDIALHLLHNLTPEYSRRVSALAGENALVIASHPYAMGAISAATAAKRLCYEAHNHEAALKASMLPDTFAGLRLLQAARDAEQQACTASTLILTVTDSDASSLRQDYRFAENKLRLIPNGVDLDSVPFVPWSERAKRRRSLGLTGPAVLYMASWHGPNIEAFELVSQVALKLPHATFLVVGSVCHAIKDRAVPSNAKLLGVVDDVRKAELLGAVDVALNPMLSGSGSNMKMLDYLAAGVPVISTAFGARGIPKPSEHVVIAEPGSLADAISALLASGDRAEDRTVRGRALVEGEFDWRKIADRMRASIAPILG